MSEFSSRFFFRLSSTSYFGRATFGVAAAFVDRRLPAQKVKERKKERKKERETETLLFAGFPHTIFLDSKSSQFRQIQQQLNTVFEFLPIEELRIFLSFVTGSQCRRQFR